MAADETRILRMQFDNSKFDRRIAKSQNSLEKFKEALNFDETSRGLQNFTKSANGLDFSGLFDNIQRLTDRFTGLGDVGDYILRRIRSGFDSVAMSAEALVKSLSSAQIKIGENKYSALTKAVQTIVAGGEETEEHAYDVMGRVMEYTNQTSHSFEVMVGRISSLNSVGVPLEKAERLLEGFANSATKAGADAGRAATAMEVYSKAMGSILTKQEFDTLNLTARVITKEWREGMIEAGLATKDLEKDTNGVIRTAKKYGKQVEVTAETIENTLNKKWVTRDTLQVFGEKYMFGETLEDLKHPEKAIDSFGKTAYLTGQRALTLADAFNAMKESVSSGWMESFRIVFGDLTDAIELFTNIADRAIESLERISEIRNNILRSWRLQGGRDSLIDLILGDYGKETAEGAYGFLDIIDDVGKLIYRGIADLFGLFADPDDRLMFQNDPEYFASWLGIKAAEISKGFEGFLRSIRDWFGETIEVGGKTTTRLEILHSVIDGLVAALGLGLLVIQGLYTFVTTIGAQLEPAINNILGMFGLLGSTLYGDVWDAAREDTITQFFEQLAITFKPLTDGINDIVQAFTDLIGILVETDQQNGGSKSVFQYIGDALKWVAGIISAVGTPILTFLKNIILAVKDLLTGADAEHAESKGVFGAIGDLFTGILSAFGEGGAETLHERLQKVAGWFKEVNLGTILKLVLGGIMVAKFIQMIHNTSKAFKRIGEFFEDPGGNFKQGFVGNYEWFSERLLNIGKAIATIAGAVVVLGSLPTSSLIQGVIATAAVMGAMFLFVKAFSTVKGTFLQQMAITNTIRSVANSMSKLCISLGVLVMALSPLKDMEWSQFGKMMAGLGGILLQLIAFMIVTSKLPIGTGQLGGFIGFALSIGILVKAIQPFATMDWGQYARMMAGLAGVFLEIIGFMELFKVLGLSTKALNFNGIIRFSLAIAILVLAIQPFASMSWDQYARAMAGLGGTLLEILAFMELFKLLGLSTKALKFDGIARFAIAIGILVLAIQPFASMNWDQYARVMAGLGGVLLEIVAFMELFKVLGLSTKALKFDGIIIFTLAIALLVMAIKPFADMSWESYARVMAGLGGVLAEIILFMEAFKILGLSTKALKFDGITLFAAAIAILVYSIQPFADMTWDQYATVMAGLGGVLVGVIAALALMKIVTRSMTASGFAKVALSLVAISMVMGSFANALAKVKDMKWETIMAFAVGLSVVLVALGGALALTSKFGSFKGILILAAGLAAIIAVLATLGPWLMTSLGRGLADMSGYIATMADMFQLFSDRMAGVNDGAVGKAQGIVDGIKALMGSIGSVGQLVSNTSGFATAMFNLGTAFEILDTHTGKVKDSTGATVINLVKDLAGCADDLETISNMKIGDLALRLNDLGGAMMLYAAGSDSMIGIDPNQTPNIEAALTLLEGISEAMSKKTGVFSIPNNLPSEGELGHFGNQLAALAGALIKFEDAGSGIGIGTHEALKTLEFFRDLKRDLMAYDTFNDLSIIGELNSEFESASLDTNSLTTFGTNIEQLAIALATFVGKTTTVDEVTGESKSIDFEGGIAALERFAEMQKRLSQIKFGGWVSVLHGNGTKLSDFGNDIQLLSSDLMTFSNKITGQGAEGTAGVQFDSEKTTEVIGTLDSMITFLTDVNTKLPKLGGLSNFFTTLWSGREYSFKDLGDQVGQMGEGLGKLGAGLNTGNWSKGSAEGAKNALDALDSVLAIMIRLGQLHEQSSIYGGYLFGAGTELNAFLEGIVLDSDKAGITNLVAIMSQINDEFDEYGDIDASRIEMYSTFLQALAALASVNPEYDWKVIGINIDTGIAEGLAQGTNDVVAAAKEVARAAYTAAMEELNAHSPSRLFMEVGGYIGEGMAIGILDSSNLVASGMEDTTKVAVTEAGIMLAAVSQALAEDMDSQPTITPVLDLSNIHSGMRDFNRNFTGWSVGIDADRSAAMAYRAMPEFSNGVVNQNGTDLSGIKGQLASIETSMNELGERIANIKIVLDTGVMVGEMSDGVDENIGLKEFYSSRNN